VGDLHVMVHMNDTIVDDRVMAVRDVVRIGEQIGAAVAFPGANVAICRVGSELDVRGRRLGEGDSTTLDLGQVHVELHHLVPESCRRPGPMTLDLRFLLVALGVTVGGMWVDLSKELLPFAPSPMSERAAVQHVTLGPDTPVPSLRGEGRTALPDDALTGYRYHPWYRGAVPSTLNAELARIRLESDPLDLVQRALVARGAYDSDAWADALLHYEVLVDAHPENTTWLYGQAGAQKRLGSHRGEISTYIRILDLNPDDVQAMGSRAVAHARLGDYDGADYWLVRMRSTDSENPYLYVYEAMVSAIEGDDDGALVLLEQAVSTRHELPDGLQLELRRDIALDPALGSLRGDARLRRMLSRHYGADHPRRMRI